MQTPLILATRKSRLALKQTQMAREALLAQGWPGSIELLELSTQGDERLQWSLERKGGKGLFTKELEQALLDRRADLAVHSAKDLPTAMPDGLEIAGFLPRAPAGDVFIYRSDCESPQRVATGSPRRRTQAMAWLPETVSWQEIRGNVETRLRKIVDGEADATFLAQAGLQRLGITEWEGLTFRQLQLPEMVPAAGQGAIALQCRLGERDRFTALLCKDTGFAVACERLFLNLLGGGCHAATAAHWHGDCLYAFDAACGRGKWEFPRVEYAMDAAALLTDKPGHQLRALAHDFIGDISL